MLCLFSLLKRIRMKKGISKGVIICGGRGGRMGDNYAYTQKCLLPIAGKPILTYLLESFRANNINDLLLLTNHYAKDVESFVNTINIPELNIGIVRSNSEGTAGALKELSDLIDEPFIYCHGNIIFPDKWIAELLNFYESTKPTALFAASPVDLISTHPHIIGTNNKIEQIIFPNGKRIPFDTLCALEMTVFSPEIFDIIETLDNSKRLCFAFTDQKTIDEYILMYYEVNGMWIHVEIPNDLKKASSQIELVKKLSIE